MFVASHLEFSKYPGGVPSVVAPEVRRFLEDHGVPRAVLTIFRAVEEPFVPSCAELAYSVNGVAIGYSREDDEICISSDTGQVLILASWSPAAPLVVNRDIAAFVDSLIMLNGMLPLYGVDRDLDVSEAAADRLRFELQRLDVTSTEDPNSFWSAFLDDVAVGDYPGK
ncbi:SUKH-4 family immunity protein [Streptomyces sp. NPDC126933]|uniref:SUKH-4 family immunity protein n=1 Tax=unclassified Streptomyces TaxID=2593676 RepID=UPI003652A79B